MQTKHEGYEKYKEENEYSKALQLLSRHFEEMDYVMDQVNEIISNDEKYIIYKNDYSSVKTNLEKTINELNNLKEYFIDYNNSIIDKIFFNRSN